jgi:hypothetical protein
MSIEDKVIIMDFCFILKKNIEDKGEPEGFVPRENLSRSRGVRVTREVLEGAEGLAHC